jgi:vacuolar protein sorting-associated protein 26B
LTFRPNAEIEILLDRAENRKLAEVKSEDGKKEKFYVFYDGETVSGKVFIIIF